MPQRPNITGARSGFSPRAVAGRELMPKRVGAVKGHRRDDQHRARARDSVQGHGCHLTKLVIDMAIDTTTPKMSKVVHFTGT